MKNVIKFNSYYKDKYDFNCNNLKQLSKNILELKLKLQVNNTVEFVEKLGFKISYKIMKLNDLCNVSNNRIFLNCNINKKDKSVLLAIVIMNFLLNKKQETITKKDFIDLLRDDKYINFVILIIMDGKTYLDIFKSLAPLNISMDKAFKIIEECFDVEYYIAIKRYSLMIEEGV